MATPQKAAGKEMFHENYDTLHFGLLSFQVLWTFFWNLQQHRYYVLFCNEASRKLKTEMAFRYSSLPDAWIQELWGCNSVKVAISWNESNVMTPAFFPESAWLFATIPFQIWNAGQVSKPGFGPALSAIHDDVFTYIISYSHAGWYCLCTQEKKDITLTKK